MLFQPFCLKNLSIKNRIVMPPMCMYSAGRDGMATDWHVLHYTTRAEGQVGLIIVEATGVEDRGRISDQDLGIWDDGQIAGLKKLTTAVHDRGGKVAIQLNHAGRKSEVPYLEPVAPSALIFSEEYRLPRRLTPEEIRQVVALFAGAARRAVAAGFDAIEIHAAHGYLLNQFMSPLSNNRDDAYGGSLANRARLLGEVLDAVKQVIPPEMPLWVRVTAEEYEAAGNTPDVVADMLNLVKDKGIDAVHVSSGGLSPFQVRAYPGYQIGFALTIKQKTGLPVIGGGLITDAKQAEQAAKAGVDMVFLGRELLRNPYWPLRAAHLLQEAVVWPKAYFRGRY